MANKPTFGEYRAIKCEASSIGAYSNNGARMATVKRMGDAVLGAGILGTPADADGPAVVARAAMAKARGLSS